jgi:uridylate kinase
LAYSSVLLKLSGEALGGGRGLDRNATDVISQQIAQVASTGCRLAVVVGGGNILRGRELSGIVSVQATADQMGMLATMINGLVLMDGLERAGQPTRLMSAVSANQICEPFRPPAPRRAPFPDGGSRGGVCSALPGDRP